MCGELDMLSILLYCARVLSMVMVALDVISVLCMDEAIQRYVKFCNLPHNTYVS